MEENNKNEKLTPYQQVALKALQQWNGMSYEEALTAVSECTTEEKIDELDSKIGANYSVKSALFGIVDHLYKNFVNLEYLVKTCQYDEVYLNEAQKYPMSFLLHGRKLKKTIKEIQSLKTKILEKFGENAFSIYQKYLNDPNLEKDIYFFNILSQGAFYNTDISSFKENIKDLELNGNNLVIATLDRIHSDWIENADISGRFFQEGRENTRYQFMNSSLIGFEEIKKDLIFVQPVFETLGIECSEEGLQKAYTEYVKDFCAKHNIDSRASLIDSIEATNPNVTQTSAYSFHKFKENRDKRKDELTNPLIAEQIAEQLLEHNPILSQIFEEKSKNAQIKPQTLLDKIRSKLFRKSASNKSSAPSQSSSFTQKREEFLTSQNTPTTQKINTRTQSTSSRDVEQDLDKTIPDDLQQ